MKKKRAEYVAVWMCKVILLLMVFGILGDLGMPTTWDSQFVGIACMTVLDIIIREPR